MLRKNNKFIIVAVSLCFLMSLFVPMVTPEKAEAQTDLSDLIIQAVFNNYHAFTEGKTLDAYDAYILTQAGADLDTWTYEEDSLEAKILSIIDETIAQSNAKTIDWSGEEVYEKSSKTIAQQYLAAKGWNEKERADQLLLILKNRQIESSNGSIDNNPFADIAVFELIGRSDDIADLATGATITYILDNRDNETGAWTSSWNDFMTTAQAIRALSYLKDYAGDQESDVQQAINAGLEWLLSFQDEDGSFALDLDDPVIDTSELIYTSILLGIDPLTLVNEKGKNPVEYLTEKALNDDGTFGISKNIMDNTWVLDAYLQLGGNINTENILDVKVDPQNINMKLNETKQLIANASKLIGSQEDVSSIANWSVEDPDIASIENTGLLTALSAGSTIVKAAYGSAWGSASVTIHGNDGSPGVKQPKSITVNIAVVGGSGNLLYGPGTVRISENDEFGLTAMGALDATGLSWEFSDKWEGCIDSIEGEANQGMNGWMFSVNGINPPDIPENVTVSSDAKIIFWYSTEAMGQGPDWNDILSGNLENKTVNNDINNEELEKTLNSYNDELTDLHETFIFNENKKMALKDIEKLKEELDANKVDLYQEIDETEAVIADIEVSMLIPENALSQSTNITIKELAVNKAPKEKGIKLGSSVYQFGPRGTKFNKSVTISIKFPLTEDLHISNLTPAWFDEGLQKWIPIPGIIDLESGLAVFKVDHFTAFAVIEAKAPVVIEPIRITFVDVNSDISWAKDAIEILAGKGIIHGTGEGKFEPNRLISRAEYVKLLVSAQQLEPLAYQNGIFDDIDSSQWFADAVATACHNQIIAGYPDNTFRPEKSISRNEAASILHRLEGTTESKTNIVFDDNNEIPAWAYNGVGYVYNKGLMIGYEDNTFKGSKPLTRAEAAVIIYNYLNISDVKGAAI